MKRLHLISFGCQMNVYDGELMASAFKRAGYERALEPRDADVILVNTCAVREHAEEKVFSHLGALAKVKRKRPEVLLGVTGCMAERLGKEIARRAPYVDIIAGARSFGDILDLAGAARDGAGAVVSIGHDRPPPERDVSVRSDPHRAFVAVSRGCDHRCTFCIVPSTRGPERGRPLAEIVAEVESLVADGVVEITLLGQNIDSYGKDRPEGEDLHRLLHACHAVGGLKRLRFVTSHPEDMELEVLDDMASLPKLCDALHVPPQSGSNRVLRRMARGYTRERYLELVREFRTRVPEGQLAADFIVGFPGETEADFEQSVSLLHEVGFQQSFVFRYSPRPGTPSANHFEDDVPMPVKAARNMQLLKAQEAVSKAMHASMVGRSFEVLVEGPSKKDPDYLTGRSRGNHLIHFRGTTDLAGELVDVRVTDFSPISCRGELLEG
ncbi:MAG: tRNA (N6-isopentenyl adenosine(37)-C2)-methylthiotransferase MiaB [Planctomycetota bacterium]|jgi:tRNA-2-methylthio-N6-dimethylallyladenosine synthase